MATADGRSRSSPRSSHRRSSVCVLRETQQRPAAHARPVLSQSDDAGMRRAARKPRATQGPVKAVAVAQGGNTATVREPAPNPKPRGRDTGGAGTERGDLRPPLAPSADAPQSSVRLAVVFGVCVTAPPASVSGDLVVLPLPIAAQATQALGSKLHPYGGDCEDATIRVLPLLSSPTTSAYVREQWARETHAHKSARKEASCTSSTTGTTCRSTRSGRKYSTATPWGARPPASADSPSSGPSATSTG